MPLSLVKKLNLGQLAPTTLSLQMADHSRTYLKDIIEDVLVKVDKFIFLVEFFVLDVEKDCKIPIAYPYPTRSDWRIQTKSRGTRSSLSFPVQIQKKKIQYKCEYILITKRISNTHWVYIKIYIKHF